jgi:hypothetical protein
LLFETGTKLDKEEWMANVTTNASSLRGTTAATAWEFGIAEFVVVCGYQAV